MKKILFVVGVAVAFGVYWFFIRKRSTGDAVGTSPTSKGDNVMPSHQSSVALIPSASPSPQPLSIPATAPSSLYAFVQQNVDTNTQAELKAGRLVMINGKIQPNPSLA